jgi:hypothetical protein
VEKLYFGLRISHLVHDLTSARRIDRASIKIRVLAKNGVTTTFLGCFRLRPLNIPNLLAYGPTRISTRSPSAILLPLTMTEPFIGSPPREHTDLGAIWAQN